MVVDAGLLFLSVLQQTLSPKYRIGVLLRMVFSLFSGWLNVSLPHAQ